MFDPVLRVERVDVAPPTLLRVDGQAVTVSLVQPSCVQVVRRRRYSNSSEQPLKYANPPRQDVACFADIRKGSEHLCIHPDPLTKDCSHERIG
eukprot:1180652-Prorocentrum_minimum.AAC.1